MKKRNRSIVSVIACLLLVIPLAGCKPMGQKSIYGTWEIETVVFVSPPHREELDEILSDCLKQKVIITDSSFVFTSSDCFLFKTISNFKIGQSIFLNKTQAQERGYFDKVTEYVFGDKENKITVFPTNYDFKSDEGPVEPLDIIFKDDSHIILYQYENIVFLKRNDQ